MLVTMTCVGLLLSVSRVRREGSAGGRVADRETRRGRVKVLLSGGGTAGHIYPALTVAARFAAEHDDVVFVGTPDGLEARLVPEAGIEFVGLPREGTTARDRSTLDHVLCA